MFLLVAGWSLGDPAEPDLPPVEPSSVGYLAQRVRRLGSRELAQSIRDLTGVAVSDSRVAALYVHRKYDNGDPDAWVTSDVLAAVEELAWFVADEVVRTHSPRVFADCAGLPGERACRERLIGTVVPRIYRRSLTAGEANVYGALWD